MGGLGWGQCPNAYQGPANAAASRSLLPFHTGRCARCFALLLARLARLQSLMGRRTAGLDVYSKEGRTQNWAWTPNPYCARRPINQTITQPNTNLIKQEAAFQGQLRLFVHARRVVVVGLFVAVLLLDADRHPPRRTRRPGLQQCRRSGCGRRGCGLGRVPAQGRQEGSGVCVWGIDGNRSIAALNGRMVVGFASTPCSNTLSPLP